MLGPLFCTAGHRVRTQFGVTAPAGQRRGDVEIRDNLRDAASNEFNLCEHTITHTGHKHAALRCAHAVL